MNSKGHYDVTAIIDGRRGMRFVRPNMGLYSDLTERDIYNLSDDDKTGLAEALFPPE